MEIWRKPNVQPFFLLKSTPTAKPGYFLHFSLAQRGTDMERHWILLESDQRNNFAYGPKNWSLMEIWRKQNVQPFFLLKTTPTAKRGCFLHFSLAQHGQS